MERSEIRDSLRDGDSAPDFASLHPGYDPTYFGNSAFSLSTSRTFILKPPGITMSPGF
jgi:hypothetical protein